jgi:hypothetical protein
VLGKAVAHLATAQESLMQAAMLILGWSQGDKMQLIPLQANRFLKMMSEVAVGWLLLDAAVIAHKKAEGAGETEKAFFEGKQASALWYARNVLPNVELGQRMMAEEDMSPVELSDAAFATLD